MYTIDKLRTVLLQNLIKFIDFFWFVNYANINQLLFKSRIQFIICRDNKLITFCKNLN